MALRTCDDVYRLPYYFSTTNVKSYLIGNYYNHIKELNVGLYPCSDGGSNAFFRKITQANTRVIIKVHMHFQRDFRRFWRIASVWYRDENGIDTPFMVVQNSGREGDDYYYRFISDTDIFCEALNYLSQIFRQNMTIEDCNLNDIPWEVTEDMIALKDDEDEEDSDTIICVPNQTIYGQEWVGSWGNKHHFKKTHIGEFHGQEYFATLQGFLDGAWFEDGYIVTSEDEGVCD